jgi:peptidyl-tRNA hydrolase
MSTQDRVFTDEAEPWALNLVVRVERESPPHHTDVLEAAASATVRLLFDERASAQWESAITRWNDGRIRKLCRRARGTQWAATDELDHVEVTVGSASVRAFVPVAVESQPRALHRLQMSGTEFLDSEPPVPAGIHEPTVWLNPTITMTSAKAAVQASHAAQLLAVAWHTKDSTAFLAWLGQGARVRVRVGDERFGALASYAQSTTSDIGVVIHDAGFTEVMAGSLTAVGLLR